MASGTTSGKASSKTPGKASEAKPQARPQARPRARPEARLQAGSQARPQARLRARRLSWEPFSTLKDLRLNEGHGTPASSTRTRTPSTGSRSSSRWCSPGTTPHRSPDSTATSSRGRSRAARAVQALYLPLTVKAPRRRRCSRTRGRSSDGNRLKRAGVSTAGLRSSGVSTFRPCSASVSSPP